MYFCEKSVIKLIAGEVIAEKRKTLFQKLKRKLWPHFDLVNSPHCFWRWYSLIYTLTLMEFSLWFLCSLLWKSLLGNWIGDVKGRDATLLMPPCNAVWAAESGFSAIDISNRNGKIVYRINNPSYCHIYRDCLKICREDLWGISVVVVLTHESRQQLQISELLLL